MFKANTADGQAVIIDSTGFNIVNASGGEFTYQVPNALAAVPGKIVTAYFSFSDASGTESTFDVAFIIKKAVDATQAQADDYITIIDGTLQSLQQKIDAMSTDVQTIINAFNQGDFYNQAQTDSKDAATLAGAKSYSDSNLAKAKEYTEDANDFVLGDGMHFVAHRGNNAEWPENSKAAFRTVTRHWGIETDISVTKDGYWVIMHDATVDRTTNGNGNIADMTFAQIQALKIDTGTNVSYLSADDLKVPTVEDYLAFARPTTKLPS
ncbi:glycerophosphodiester phosphodiesterase family protein [Lacticaseibacillus nasuensis]|uniref:glycerophosphodiester phosphodiesterase family protein n=1 Tax=Lacticaseibacillus nasuensis TaxID=944671 RepID=UPI0006D02493|nr:glycerophosphodiester phosphodiesterase family protein [Lacticaseibacillus nasuensis]